MELKVVSNFEPPLRAMCKFANISAIMLQVHVHNFSMTNCIFVILKKYMENAGDIINCPVTDNQIP